MEGRVLFHQILVSAGLAIDGRLLAEAETIRQRMDRLDETVLRYRRDYTTAAPLTMLSQLMLEFTDVQVLAAERQPASLQRRLSHVTATL